MCAGRALPSLRQPKSQGCWACGRGAAGLSRAVMAGTPAGAEAGFLSTIYPEPRMTQVNW